MQCRITVGLTECVDLEGVGRERLKECVLCLSAIDEVAHTDQVVHSLFLSQPYLLINLGAFKWWVNGR